MGLAEHQRDRLLAADWGRTSEEAGFSADLEVVAMDRQGLLRDISEAIARERINVTAVNTLSRGTHAFMRFTLQVSSADGIQRVLRQVKDVPGVDSRGGCERPTRLEELDTRRRQLDERLATLLRDARKAGTVVTVALADVDHFKGINDRFSHAVGDEVLRCVGEVLRAHCRLGDLAGRYGGEEFMLVFRNLEMRAATETCERVRRAVEAWDWKSIHPQLRVTLSMGLASSSSFDEPQGLLDAADHWLYEAKHHGRNQIQPLVVAPA